MENKTKIMQHISKMQSVSLLPKCIKSFLGVISYVFAYMNADPENIIQHCILIVCRDGRVGIVRKP
jgi:hypothetical protein